MSPEEKIDADAVKNATADLAVQCLSACRHLYGLSLEQLSHRGYKTEAEAVHGTVKFYQAKIDKLWKEFVKRWPDSN